MNHYISGDQRIVRVKFFDLGIVAVRFIVCMFVGITIIEMIAKIVARVRKRSDLIPKRNLCQPAIGTVAKDTARRRNPGGEIKSMSES